MFLIFLPLLLSSTGFQPEPLGPRSCRPHPHRPAGPGTKLDHFLVSPSRTVVATTNLRLLQVLHCWSQPSPNRDGKPRSSSWFPLAHSVCSHTFGLKRILFKVVLNVIIRRLDVLPSKFFFTIYNDDWKECNLITSLKIPQLSIYREEN